VGAVLLVPARDALDFTVLPGKAFAATAVSAPVSAAVPASSHRLLRARRRSAASRVAGV
jgi:hypothetical protein